MYLRLAETTSIPTAGTDGRSIVYNKEFIDKLDDAELQFLMAHEVMHVVFKHVNVKERRGARDPLVWNFATDYVINGMLKESKFKVLDSALLDDKFKGMNSEQVYDNLINDEEFMKKLDQMCTLDDHGVMEEAEEPGSIEKREWLNRVTQATQRAKMAGKLPSGIAEMVDNVLSPKIDFYSLLEQTIKACIKDDHTIVPPNKRMLAHDIYLFGYTGSQIRLAVLIDSSGSVGTRELQYFVGALNDIMGMFRSFEIDVIAFSHEVHSHKKFVTGDSLPKEGYGFEDRGGTQVSTAFNWLKDNMKDELDGIIVCSDGDFFSDLETIAQPDCDVIWVLTRTTDRPRFGKVIPLEAI
jgi:predicted metal-dependent peptidase